MIERQLAGAAPEQYQQHRGLLDVGRPRHGIDENLDHSRRGEQHERGDAGQQAEHQQRRRGQLDAERYVGRILRRQWIFKAARRRSSTQSAP
jgi:hypothetical protein